MNTLHITLVVGNAADRSRTKVLAQGIAQALTDALGQPVNSQVLELWRLAPDIAVAGWVSDLPPAGAAALKAISQADLVIAVTPVYKGSYSGLFKHLFDLLDPDALVGKPVLLAANGGSDRHALVVDHQLRPLFAFFRALTVPSAVYAAEPDFDGYTLRSPALLARIEEAAGQAALLLRQRRAATPDRALREAA